MDVSQLTAYQASVYIGLTEVVHPEYSDTEALALIEKHKDLIENRERRRFEPYATARAIQERENSVSLHEREVLIKALRKAKETIRAFNGLGMTGEVEQACWDAYQRSPEMQEINRALGEDDG